MKRIYHRPAMRVVMLKKSPHLLVGSPEIMSISTESTIDTPVLIQ